MSYFSVESMHVMDFSKPKTEKHDTITTKKQVRRIHKIIDEKNNIELKGNQPIIKKLEDRKLIPINKEYKDVTITNDKVKSKKVLAESPDSHRLVQNMSYSEIHNNIESLQYVDRPNSHFKDLSTDKVHSKYIIPTNMKSYGSNKNHSREMRQIGNKLAQSHKSIRRRRRKKAKKPDFDLSMQQLPSNKNTRSKGFLSGLHCRKKTAGRRRPEYSATLLRRFRD